MSKHWLLLAAAGNGSRMSAERPKQYLPLLGRTVIEHSLDKLMGVPAIAGGIVVLAADDRYWPTLAYRSDKPLWLTAGGSERCQSVYNGLSALAPRAKPDDWVVVHDAARPCIRQSDIEQLFTTLLDDPVGGLLAVPVKDTLKRADRELRVSETENRDQLWQAQTPQVFRLQILQDALSIGLRQGKIVTDEAAAIEDIGLSPRLVQGHYDNIKITTPEDLILAEFYMNQYAVV